MNKITHFKSFIHSLCKDKTKNELIMIEENFQGLLGFLDQFL
jgi:hypothetical protein